MSKKRPNCVACGKMFSDDDVEKENYVIVGMSLENGPSFRHKQCPQRRGLYE